MFFVNDDHKTKINNESFLYNTESPNIETTIVEPLKVTIKIKTYIFILAISFKTYIYIIINKK